MKRIVSLLLSLCMIFSFATICYADDETVIPPVSNEMIINPYLRSTATFGSCKIDQGVTMGFASGDNGWAIAANTTVTLKFYMKTKESNVNCGYYQGSTYVQKSHTVKANSSGDGYVYTCTMKITKGGNYKFFISNMTAKTITVTKTTVSF